MCKHAKWHNVKEMGTTEFHKNFVYFHFLRLFISPLVTLIAGGAQYEIYKKLQWHKILF